MKEVYYLISCSISNSFRPLLHKVLINYFEGRSLIRFSFISGIQETTGNTQGISPLVGHSLSWRYEKDSTVGHYNKRVAKIWTPSDPSQSNCNEGSIPSDQRRREVYKS